MKLVLASPLLNGLLALCMCSVLLLLVPFMVPLPGEASRALVDRSNSQKDSRVQQGSSNYTGALDRPIFHVNRRKPMAVVVKAAPVVKKRLEARFKLVGIVGSGNRRSAYLQHIETGDTRAVRGGESAGKWIVDEIGPDFVALRQGQERRVIKLDSGG